MTGKQLKRLVLAVATLVVVVLLGSSLWASLSEPQVNNRLQLYQTDLLLHATELKSDDGADADLTTAQTALLGNDPLSSALEEYQTVRESAETNLKRFQTELAKLTSPSPTIESPAIPTPSSRPSAQVRQLQLAVQQQQDLLDQLDLRIGILQVEQNRLDAAIVTWTTLIDRAETQTSENLLAETATVLTGLWSNPPRLLPDAEQALQRHLEGWFRYKALMRLYELQQRSDTLVALQAAEQQIAQETVFKLALVGVMPAFGGIIGVVLLIVLIIQWVVRGKQALLAENENLAWSVPWDWETTLQVLVLGFFFVGQIALPLLLGTIGLRFTALGNRAEAVYTVFYYLLMSGSGLLILYLSVKPYFPLPEDWFRLLGKRNWFVWGLGGYLVALPLMLGISVINQQIWQGQGGSNPLLQTVLEEGDRVALAIFLFTAAVAAPVFEELLFRGFLLPSLTRYVPVWGAIVLSSLLFAIAHLSLSEVLPLAVLGSVLGFVYTRSRGLLAPMLLHSLWNSVTMLGLFILGSGAK
ncbi:MAG: CPBP family intramembrane metalloprotease [Cyanobacteria bacterium CRU_2_1]|nr:CPBP family intramembrane metalloprotease [Cyanobacteria bacterium RU_5_0]NJR61551.1 CPBP family intramembrane metalloprotease [Cyanobacteria bacterium CRU_2_1]